MTALQSPVQPRLYFGYGSNLWKEQMMLRCPQCTYIGVGRLTQYYWIINGRGYANVVSSEKSDDEVYGLVYELTPVDENRLDFNEGVPFAYDKNMFAIDLWESKDGKKVDVSLPGMKKDVLVYIDRKRVVHDSPQEEYIYRMNRGIKDAVDAGIPFAYVQKVISPFIPERAKEEVYELARKQALNFEERK